VKFTEFDKKRNYAHRIVFKTTIHIYHKQANKQKGDGKATLLPKLDLLTSLMQDMVPVVKTLQEAHDASLLQDVDDADDPPLSDSENEEDPPTTRGYQMTNPPL